MTNVIQTEEEWWQMPYVHVKQGSTVANAIQYKRKTVAQTP